MSANSSSRSVTAPTLYPCSRNSHERAPATTGCPSATMTRPPWGGVSVAEVAPESFPLDVATTENGNGGPCRLALALEQRRDGNRAARLDHELQAIEQQTHRTLERGVVHEHHVVDVALMMRERHRSDLNAEKTVGETTGVVELTRAARCARATQLRRPGRLDADDARVGQAQLDRGRHTRAEAAAADGNEHRLDVGKVLGDLQADGALPRDDPLIVVGRNERQPFVAHELLGAREPVRGRR